MNELITPTEEKTIESEFRLGAIVRRKVGCSTYETAFEKKGEPPRAAVIKICEVEESLLASTVARWKSVMELDHPNLLGLYAAGASRMEGLPVAYLVMERADESLAGVLARRALTVEEVREMLDPALSALEHLHKNGYAHNGLKPANIFAVGDRLKLASDSLVRMGEGGSADEDVRALGALLLEVMTSPEGTYSPKPPYGEIVRRCLEEDPAKRWTLDQVRARLIGKPEPPVVLPPPVEPAIAAAPVKEPVRMPLEDREESPRGFPKWVFAALAALVAVVLLGAIFRKKEPISAASPAPTVVVREAPRVTPSIATPVEPAPPRPREVSAVSGAGKGGWSVIVAAYGSQAAAEKRAHSMAAKWSGFHLSVLERQRERARYLVVLGDHLSQDEARALKERAVHSGLPRDTYIKKLM